MTIFSNPWILCPKPNPSARLRLFCFPCAGGMATAFNAWGKFVPPSVELCSIQLPGRGKRMSEPPFKRLTPLLQTLAPILQGYLDKPFAFLGHSLGAVIALEMVRELRRQSASEPEHLLICGCSAPKTRMVNPSVYKLPEAAFIAELCHRYNAIPESIRQDEELMALFLPTLRADFALLENYVYTPENPLDCRISVFGGLQDRAVRENSLVGWQEQTQGLFALKMLQGDHFFLHNHPSVMLQAIDLDAPPTY